MPIELIERDVTKAELDRVHAGFCEHGIEHGIPPHAQSRYGLVAMDGDKFVGCASGLADTHWFFITDLWLEKEYRGQGIGTDLLRELEKKAGERGIRNMWTWTADYEAPEFYKKLGYKVFCELEDYYPTGHSRIGLRKAVS